MCQKGKMTIDKQSIHNWDAASHAYDLQNETLLTRKLSCFYANYPQYLFFLIIIIKHKSKILQDKKSLH